MHSSTERCSGQSTAVEQAQCGTEAAAAQMSWPDAARVPDWTESVLMVAIALTSFTGQLVRLLLPCALPAWAAATCASICTAAAAAAAA